MHDLDKRAVLEGLTLSRGDILSISSGQGAATVRECVFVEGDLADLDLEGWRFESCQLNHADLRGARLRTARFVSCRGSFASFVGADLTEATVDSCDFNNAVLRGATLTEAAFTDSKLTGANLSEVRAFGFKVDGVLLNLAKLPGISFRKMRLRRVDFRGLSGILCGRS